MFTGPDVGLQDGRFCYRTIQRFLDGGAHLAAKKKKKARGEAADSKVGDTKPGLSLQNALLGIVLGLALLSRLYYLFLTSEQPIWWDEGNYLVKAKSIALGTPDTGYDSGRPILFSILMGPFFALGLGEFAIRLVLSLSSFLSVYLTYRIGTRLINPWVGIIAAALFSSHYLNLFYTQRIMCEIPYLTMTLLAVNFFLSERRVLVWAAGPCFAVSVMLRYPAFVVPLAILVFVLLTERTKALRKVDYWISAGLAALAVAPDLLLRGRGTLSAVSSVLAPRTPLERLRSLGETVDVFFGTLDHMCRLGLVLGLLLSAWHIVKWKSQESGLKRSHLLLVLWLVAPLVLQGLWITHLEDRYLYASLVPAFLLVASVCWHAVSFCPQWGKEGALGLVVLAVLGSYGFSFQFSHRQILSKLETYGALKIAGEWLKQHGDGEGVVLSQSIAQLTYYSELPGRVLPPRAEDFVATLSSGQAKYGVLSGFEQNPDWVTNLQLEGSGLKVAMSYPPEGQAQVLVLERN